MMKTKIRPCTTPFPPLQRIHSFCRIGLHFCSSPHRTTPSTSWEKREKTQRGAYTMTMGGGNTFAFWWANPTAKRKTISILAHSFNVLTYRQREMTKLLFQLLSITERIVFSPTSRSHAKPTRSLKFKTSLKLYFGRKQSSSHNGQTEFVKE